MKNKLPICIIALIFSIVIFSCANQEKSEKLIDFSSYSLRLKKGWEIDEEFEDEDYFAISKEIGEKSGEHLHFVVYIDTIDIELNKYVEYMNNLNIETFDSYKVLKKKKINDNQYLIVGEVVDGSSIPALCYYYFFFEKELCFLVSYGSPIENFEKYKPEMEEIFNSFTIKYNEN